MLGHIVIAEKNPTPPIQFIEVGTMQMIQENSVAVSNALYGAQMPLIATLGAMVGNDSINEVLASTNENQELWECIIKCESNFNINALGDHGYSFGILQFKKKTFDLFVKNLDLEWAGLEYENPIHQILLADLAVKENRNNFNHWTCFSKCK